MLQLEPRVLWSVASVDSADTAVLTPNTRFRMGEKTRDFVNGGRHPIELRYLLISGINYIYRQNRDVAATSLTTFDNDMGIINKCSFYLEAPRRQQMVISDMIGAGFQRMPTGSPTAIYGTNTLNLSTHSSDEIGISRWTFDEDLRLLIPRGGTIQFGMTAYNVPDIAAFLSSFTSEPLAYYLFDEIGYKDGGGKFGGTSRVKPWFQLRAADASVSTGIYPGGPVPFAPDAFGIGIPAAGLLSSTAGFPGEHEFTAREWISQESQRGAEASQVCGFSVGIEQIVYDTAINAFSFTAPIAPLSARIGTRARSKDFGTGEWWWRPGAPLCLVTPTLTPAQVFKLAKPITLGPGEGIIVEVQVPSGTSVDASPPATLNPIYNIGLSLAGHAIIEG